MHTRSTEHQPPLVAPTHRPTTVDPADEHAIQATLTSRTGLPMQARCVPLTGRAGTHKTQMSRTHAYRVAGNEPSRDEINQALIGRLKWQPPVNPLDEKPHHATGEDATEEDSLDFYIHAHRVSCTTRDIDRPTEDRALDNVMWETDPLIALWEELLSQTQ